MSALFVITAVVLGIGLLLLGIRISRTHKALAIAALCSSVLLPLGAIMISDFWLTDHGLAKAKRSLAATLETNECDQADAAHAALARWWEPGEQASPSAERIRALASEVTVVVCGQDRVETLPIRTAPLHYSDQYQEVLTRACGPGKGSVIYDWRQHVELSFAEFPERLFWVVVCGDTRWYHADPDDAEDFHLGDTDTRWAAAAKAHCGADDEPVIQAYQDWWNLGQSDVGPGISVVLGCDGNGLTTSHNGRTYLHFAARGPDAATQARMRQDACGSQPAKTVFAEHKGQGRSTGRVSSRTHLWLYLLRCG